MKQPVIILLGPPGSGKGSQALLMKEQLNLPHISTGDLLRENLANGTDLGKKAAPYLESGKLAPDELIISMLMDRIGSDDCKAGFILDGFPRTLPQAEKLQNSIKGNSLLVINLTVQDSVLIERITGRLICKGCGAPYHMIYSPPKKEGVCDHCGGKLYKRKDDTEEVIRTRLQVYSDMTMPLIAFYEKLGALQTIDASESKKAIFENIKQCIEKNLKRSE